jgi:hypothetical protein
MTGLRMNRTINGAFSLFSFIGHPMTGQQKSRAINGAQCFTPQYSIHYSQLIIPFHPIATAVHHMRHPLLVPIE